MIVPASKLQKGYRIFSCRFITVELQVSEVVSVRHETFSDPRFDGLDIVIVVTKDFARYALSDWGIPVVSIANED